MKKYLLLTILASVLLVFSCKQKSVAPAVQGPQFNNQLTDAEKAGGKMTPEIMWKFGRLGAMALSPDGSSVLYTVTDIDLATEARRTNIFKIQVAGGSPVQITGDGGSSPQWFNNGSSIAYINKDGDLVVTDGEGKVKQTIAGLKDFEIFNIAPTGNNIYFTRRVKLDQTANEKYNLPKAKVRIIDDLMYRHWNSWSDYSYSHVFVASFDGKSVSGEKDIMSGQKFEAPLSPYFEEGQLSWSPDGKYIAYTSKRLKGKEDARSTNSDIFLYELSSGKEVNISEQNHGYDRFPVFSPDGSKIAFQSMQRDGYEADLDRLFIYDITAGTCTWITKDWTFDVENITWADNSTIYFTCAHLGTSKVFKTGMDGKVMPVAEGKFDLGPIAYQSGVMVSWLTSMKNAPEICTINTATGEVKQLSSINKDIYAAIKMGNTEEKHVRTKDKQDLQMWVIYPPDFDPARKYPALLFCEGGPQSPLTQFWSYRWNFQMMAAKGYIVYAPNRRGVAGFGQAWKEEISQDYGGKNMQDYLDATDAMAKEPYVAAARMGCVGASYGGYSVFYLAGIHGGRFKAFVSHCGVFDFISEYGATEELWFPDFDYGGPYWDNPKGYKYSPHLRVDSWDTPILIITGANDFRIPYTQSMEAFTAAQLHNIPSRLLFFEDESHWVVRPQNSVIWQNEFFRWLDTYLK
jgi:dipeptidyl aminopeptidase/acylaminoacyl peptidase